MSARLQISRRCYGANGVQQILHRQIEAALAALARARAADEPLHQARKYMKAARATLRLLRPALGERAHRQENRTLRDAGRFLSAARDGIVLVKALDRVLCKATSRQQPLPGTARFATYLRRSAKRQQQAARRRGIPQSASKLRAALTLLDSWPPPGPGWQVILQGLRHTYRSGRRAARHNAGRASSASLHEWRKRAKHLHSQLALLAPVQHACVARMMDELHTLTEYLGEDHDCAVLREAARRHSGLFAQESGPSLLKLIDRRRSKLQRKAVAAGAAVFAEKPAHFEARLDDYFRHWPE